MAALRDNKLVLLAIFSITSVILLIFSELLAMALTTSTMAAIFETPACTTCTDSRDFSEAISVLLDTSEMARLVWRTAVETWLMAEV